jgi:hypothetical protein
MKTIKIIILVLSVTLAIGGVLYFAKDSVEPPVATKDINQYTENLLSGYQKMDRLSNNKERDKLFDNLLNKIDIYVAEDKIKSKEGNKQVKALATRFSQKFLKASFSNFSQGIWSDENVAYMLATISKMKELKNFDNSSALRGSTMDSLIEAEGIINNYKNAWNIARSTSFSSVSQARTTINSAMDMVNDKYLSECQDLVTALNAVKSKLGDSHYNFVSRQVESLANYSNYYYNQDYYVNTLVGQVQQHITDYENNAESLYGIAKNVKSLWDKADTYCEQANSYFNDYDDYDYYDDSYYYY